MSYARKQTGPRVDVAGCPVDSLTLQETLHSIDQIIAEGEPSQHVALNAAKLVRMHDDQVLDRIVKQCRIISADGQSIVWAAKLLGSHLPERVPGIDLMEALVAHAARKGYRIFFFGAEEEVVTQVVHHYRTTYPDLQVAGYRNGYYEPADEADIVTRIRNSQADVLFVAMGTPKKEYFLFEHLDRMGVPFCMGVGGSFDVVAGKVQRAPVIWQRLGLEWAYRFLQEPQRMWKRYLVGNLRFLALVLRARFQPNRKKEQLT